ncbi:hypothetical protein DW886_16915 [Enterocloster aldenensis]|uniref:hypothetical protein n=1 Tax=Enterocloster aldenensis TaxID=358742 RepID=UPI000E500ACE|nr:hypothetical protein DW886_16915 [Enterocloster aldenensis]
MNNEFFKHAKSQSVEKSSALEIIKKEALNGKVEFLAKLSHDVHSEEDFSKLVSSAAIILAENGHTDGLKQLEQIHPIPNASKIECLKAALITGHSNTAVFVKSLAQNSKGLDINGGIIHNGVVCEASDYIGEPSAVIHVSKFDTLEGLSFFGSGSQSRPSFDDSIKNIVDEYDNEQDGNADQGINESLPIIVQLAMV